MGGGEVSEREGCELLPLPPPCGTSLALLRHANSPNRTIPVHTDIAALRCRLLQVAAIRATAQQLAVIVDIGTALVKRDAVVKLEAMGVGDYSPASCAVGRSLPEPEAAGL